MDVAQGPGPRWFRIVLAVVAALYLVGLLKPPPQRSFMRPIAFFVEATALFPSSDRFATEFRLEGWSCAANDWVPLDPRPYFPIEADDKESRFQRIGHFFYEERVVMVALDDYVVAHHPDVSDHLDGPIGGIRLYRVARPIPAPGTEIARYVYEPLAPVPADQRKDLYWTKQSIRRHRCEARL